MDLDNPGLLWQSYFMKSLDRCWPSVVQINFDYFLKKNLTHIFELTFKDPFSFLKKFLMELQYSYIGLFWMFIFIAETYNFVTLFYYHVSNKRIAECVPRVNEKLFEYSLPAFWVCSSKSIIILHVWLPCITTSLPCNCWAKLFLKAASLYELAHQSCTKSICIIFFYVYTLGLGYFP